MIAIESRIPMKKPKKPDKIACINKLEIIRTVGSLIMIVLQLIIIAHLVFGVI